MRLRPCLVVPLVAAALGSAGRSAADPPPLDEKEVVREFVAGRTVDELLREIERRDPAYDLSPEMLDELRRVHLPEVLIEAMQRRTAAEAALLAPPEPPPPAESPPELRIRLLSSGVSVPRRVDPQLAAEWELGNAPADRELADLALYVACVTPEHVPDQWRLASPLGRDFDSMPRHQMLAFVSAPAGETTPHGGRIDLELPETLDVPLEPGVAHDLRLGLAVQVSGRYRRVVDDAWPVALLGEGGLELTAVIKGRDVGRLRVAFRTADDEVEEDGAAPETDP